jgi:PAS domain S-box-containing protein
MIQKTPQHHDKTSPQSAELFHLIVENISEYAIFMTDADGCVTSWNPGVEKLLGYTEGEFVGQPVSIIFTAEDVAANVPEKEMAAAALASVAEDRRWHQRRDGSRFWANGTVMPLKDENGVLRGFAKVMRDDSAQKLAEERLEEILSGITDSFYRFDTNFRYTYVNRATTEMFGISKEDFLGKTLWDIFPDVEGNNFHTEVKRALSEQVTIIFENYYEPFDRWFENRIYPSADGLSLFTSEITNRKKAEAALLKSEEKYRTLFNSIDQGFCVIEVLFDANEKAVDYKFLEYNPAFENQTGLKGAVGKTIGEIVRNHEDFWFEIYGKVALTGNSMRFEHPAAALNRWYDVYAFRIEKPENRKVAILFNDIAERKQSEEKLRFLVALNQSLLPLVEPDEIMSVTARMLGEQLKVNRCAYAEIRADEDNFRIIDDYTHDTFSTKGEHKLSDFGEEALRLMRENKPFIVTDIEQDERFKENREAYRQTEIAAAVSVPLLKNGRFVAGMAIHQKTPRIWTDDEIKLVEIVVNRCWESVERAKTLRNLRESEERFRGLQQATPDGFMLFESVRDEAGKISDFRWLYINPAAERIIGRAQAELFGKFLCEEMPGNRVEGLFDAYAQVVETGVVWQKEFSYAHENLNHYFLCTAARVSDGFAVGFSDVTERKLAERTLLERARLATLYGDIGNALVQSDTLPNLLNHCAVAFVDRLNARFVRIWTFNQTENVLELQAAAGICPQLDEKLARVSIGETTIGQIAEQRKTHLTNNIATDTPTIESEWAKREGVKAFAGYPLIVEEQLVGVMCVFSQFELTSLTLEAVESISKGIANAIERKIVEEERRQLLISEQEARRAAENANRLKDEFLATLSHELRTPLNAILGWSQMLQTRDLDEDEQSRALNTIERSARAQNQLIDDLLDVSRIINGKLRLDVRAVDLSSVIATAVEAARPAAAAKDIHLQMLLDPQAGPISGDPDRIQQIIWNLLSNAIKFTPKGGRVQARLERDNSHVEIVISDTGKGIEPEFLPYVFDRFRQSDGSTSRRQGGLGLGLAIVRQLVELHGGAVSVESEGENRGTTFTVKLPFLPAGEERRETDKNNRSSARSDFAQSADSLPELTGVRVLLVDDEEDSRDLLKFLLSSCGAITSTASSAAEALETIRRARFDVIVSDIGMPEEDGFSLIEKVRRLPDDEGGRVPAVALTAYARAEDRIKALRSGFQMHVAKPVDAGELAVVVANLAPRNRNDV